MTDDVSLSVYRVLELDPTTIPHYDQDKDPFEIHKMDIDNEMRQQLENCRDPYGFMDEAFDLSFGPGRRDKLYEYVRQALIDGYPVPPKVVALLPADPTKLKVTPDQIAKIDTLRAVVQIQRMTPYLEAGFNIVVHGTRIAPVLDDPDDLEEAEFGQRLAEVAARFAKVNRSETFRSAFEALIKRLKELPSEDLNEYQEELVKMHENSDIEPEAAYKKILADLKVLRHGTRSR